MRQLGKAFTKAKDFAVDMPLMFLSNRALVAATAGLSVFGVFNAHLAIPDTVEKPPELSQVVSEKDNGEAYRNVEAALAELKRDRKATNGLPSLDLSQETVSPKPLLSDDEAKELKERVAQHIVFNPSLSEKQAYDLTVKFNAVDQNNPLNQYVQSAKVITTRDYMAWRDECRVAFNNDVANGNEVTHCMAEKEQERVGRQTFREMDSRAVTALTVLFGSFIGISGGFIVAGTLPSRKYKIRLDARRQARKGN